MSDGGEHTVTYKFIVECPSERENNTKKKEMGSSFTRLGHTSINSDDHSTSKSEFNMAVVTNCHQCIWLKMLGLSDNFSFQNNGIKKCTCWKTMGFMGKQWVFWENNVFVLFFDTTSHMIYFDYKAYAFYPHKKNY